VAEDPGAPSFVRLARAYRRQGRTDAARDVVLRGLERHPEHIDAHALLALMPRGAGTAAGAATSGRPCSASSPANFDASRGLGFLALERGDLDAARRHLDAAARPGPTTRRWPRRWTAAPGSVRRRRRPAAVTAAVRRPASRPRSGRVPAQKARARTRDPPLLFRSLAGESPVPRGAGHGPTGAVLAGAAGPPDGAGASLLGGLLAGRWPRPVGPRSSCGWGTGRDAAGNDEATVHIAPLAAAPSSCWSRADAPAGVGVRRRTVRGPAGDAIHGGHRERQPVETVAGG
jgi:hypothetical protein